MQVVEVVELMPVLVEGLTVLDPGPTLQIIISGFNSHLIVAFSQVTDRQQQRMMPRPEAGITYGVRRIQDQLKPLHEG